MKEGTKYAVRIKEAYAKLHSSVDLPKVPEPDDPLRRLAVSIFARVSNEQTGHGAVERALETMVDWNEIRISTPSEILAATGLQRPDGAALCRNLAAALGSIYDRENKMCLDHLTTMPRREARQYLEQTEGIDAFVQASVILWSLGGHSIPVDDALLEALRDADLVYPAASRAEVQAFLQRHIGAAEAKEFCIIMRSMAKTSKVKSKKSSTPAAKTAKKITKTKKKS